jgi:hypothetical protein
MDSPAGVIQAGSIERPPATEGSRPKARSPPILSSLSCLRHHLQISDDRVFRQGLSFLLNFYNRGVRYYRHTQDGFGLPGSAVMESCV